MKTINWSIKRLEGRKCTIEFWTRPNKENVLYVKVDKPTELNIRHAIELMLGIKHFELNKVD